MISKWNSNLLSSGPEGIRNSNPAEASEDIKKGQNSVEAVLSSCVGTTIRRPDIVIRLISMLYRKSLGPTHWITPQRINDSTARYNLYEIMPK